MIEDDIFEVEQLIRLNDKSDLEWVYPENDVIEVIDSDQVLCTKNGKRYPVQGRWSLGRINKFLVKNINDITKTFEDSKKYFR